MMGNDRDIKLRLLGEELERFATVSESHVPMGVYFRLLELLGEPSVQYADESIEWDIDQNPREPRGQVVVFTSQRVIVVHVDGTDVETVTFRRADLDALSLAGGDWQDDYGASWPETRSVTLTYRGNITLELPLLRNRKKGKQLAAFLPALLVDLETTGTRPR